ncbi:Kinesin light chain [Seminavis robusta]|uniref:Kinesin light chain n=1 Tax=Seminavis robusta TaxID=568900 RepID=A0A9N8DB23_9STRA|nr:Kinesin light chain [Seminavis robusta]|eukprot:Sro20_g014370.1 Kinesin light chain (478) ;mRNA; r:152591-154024
MDDVDIGTNMGISVHWLQTGLLKEVSSEGFQSSANVYDIEPLVIRGKGRDVTCPVDGNHGSSYIHALLASGKEEEIQAVGTPLYMLSYSWNYTIQDIVETLTDFCRTNNLNPKSTYIWICCLCNNQHRVKQMQAQGKTVPFDAFQTLFYTNVTGIKNILAMMTPWKRPIYLTRMWCIFELYCAHTHPDCNLTIVIPLQEREDLKENLSGKGEDVDDVIKTLFEALASTRVQNARASLESDREAILQLIIQQSGPRGYDILNDRVNLLLREWVLGAITSLVEERNDSHQPEEAARVFHSVAYALSKVGHYKAALEMHEKALRIREDILGIDHLDTATSYRCIGSILYGQQGNLDDALLNYTRALSAFESSLGPEHPSSASLHSDIGFVLESQQHFDEALREHRLALAGFKTTHGENHSTVADCHNNVAVVLCMQGNHGAALDEFQKALAIREILLEPHHPDVVNARASISICEKYKVG